ncbi:MAG: hypothetical protein A2289_26525 [Deltaproteobacteria bacterium RIFOXYA12_FULL_58_15]|nr:MAG: hypothetical protein A2289_26525 [Deltaproteobacteria bacterium RIFOXYA12_FULL_58_15]
MPQQLVAIDMGARRARAVVIEASLRKAEITGCHSIDIDPETDVAEMMWRKVHKALPAHIDSVVVNAPTRSLSMRLLAFPFEDARKIEASLDFELENQVPYNIEDIASTWTVSERGGGKSTILAAVMPREGLLQQIQYLQQAELEPRAMVVPSAALVELVPDDSSAMPLAVLSIGERETHLAVVHGGLKFARTIRAGGANIDRALAKMYGLTVEQAGVAKEAEASIVGENSTQDARAAALTVMEGLAPVVRGVAATIKSLPSEHAPTKILLTGGTSRLPGLAEYLSEKLGARVELLDLKSCLGEITCTAPLGPEYAEALAMALASFRRGRSMILNFRRGDLSYHGDLQVYRSEVVRIGVGLAIVLVLAIGGSILRYGLIAAEESKIRQGFCDASKRIINQEVCNPDRLIAILRGGSVDASEFQVPTYSASTIFEMMSSTIGADIDVKLEDVEIKVTGRPDDPDRISAKGEAADFETTEIIANRLKTHPCVQEVEVKDQSKARQSNRVNFKLFAKVTCAPGMTPMTEVETADTATELSAADEESGMDRDSEQVPEDM